MENRRRGAGWVVAIFLGFSLLLCFVGGYFGGWFASRRGGLATEQEVAAGDAGEATEAPITCVVIDAGHGGEDGGASSAAGLVEKEVNLAIAFYLRDLFEAAGVPVVMTRVEDKLLYDRSVDYQGRKKVLDLAARHTVADAVPGGLLVSIHMNAFPQTQYSGMQVWYSVADARSQDIAGAIQAGSVALMPENNRKVKAAGSNIYLLDRATGPAVLVECGFLSNPAEAERFSDEAYRRAVAAVIFGAVMPYVGE